MSVPGGEAWSWNTRTAWQSGLSDHALCSAWRSAERRAAGVVCSPASLRRLPPEAWSDLRCRYSYLGRVFGVRSGWDLPLCSAGRVACAPAETLPADHPAIAGLLDDGCWEGEEARASGGGTSAPESPVLYNHGLAMYGRPFLSAALSSWWRTWSRRCAAPASPHSELVLCWRSGRPLEPAGELRLWLQGLGWDGVVLERDDAGRWLAVWQRERALQRRRALPRAASGPGVWRPPLATPFAVGRTLFNRQGARPVRLCGGDGLWHEGPEAMDLVLWRSRESIWASCPAAPGACWPGVGRVLRGPARFLPPGPCPYGGGYAPCCACAIGLRSRG